jgi:hypothetical protein
MPIYVRTERDLAALARIHLSYFWRHGRMPSLNDPQRFTELVQLRKLHDRDPRMPLMADKVEIKAFVTKRLGHDWVIPTLWSGAILPSDLRFDRPVIVKSRHGCNQAVVVRSDGDWTRAVHRSRKWMAGLYGGWLDEWLYRHIPRGLLVEPFIGAAVSLPTDYKVYVFHGQATHIQGHVDRATRHRWVLHDRDWCKLSRAGPTIARPSALSDMIAAAEELARGFEFARVDFYQPERQPLFGEITFYPGSGLDPFDPPELDFELGRLWLAEKKSTEVADFTLAE